MGSDGEEKQPVSWDSWRPLCWVEMFSQTDITIAKEMQVTGENEDAIIEICVSSTGQQKQL